MESTDTPPADNEPNSEVDALIEELKHAQADRRNAKAIVTFFLVVLTVFFVYLIIDEVNEFVNDETEEFGEALRERAEEIAPEVREQIGESLSVIGPDIQEALVATVKNDSDRYEAALTSEYVEIEQTAQEVWPRIEDAIVELVDQQEAVARNELSFYMSPAQVDAIGITYRKAMEEYLAEYFQKNFGSSFQVGEDIPERLSVLAESEELRSTESDYLMGLMLELLGLRLQDYSLENN